MKDVVYYELLKPNQTVTAERYQQQLIDLNHALNHKHPIIAKKKMQNDFVARQCSITRCESS